jgi:serine/threonine protein kinase
MLESGDVVGGRYRLIEPLASGGMGTVWRAHHTELGIDIALKVMLPAQEAAEQGKARFRREARAAAQLKSAHVVQVLDFGIFEEQLYLAMELLEGESLEERLDREETLTPEACADILEGVARAVQLAHDSGIVHRDLKPANIFLATVDGQEVTKVLDFGIAKDASAAGASVTTGAGLVGSPAYMSPEQVWGEPVDGASDLWSMGVVAFEMLAGENPFADATLAKVFERIVREAPPRLGERRRDLPPALDAFFERTFAREPTARFPSARAFAQGFRDAIRPLPSEWVDEHATTVETPAPARRKGGALWIAGAATLVGALALAAFARPSPVKSPTGQSARTISYAVEKRGAPVFATPAVAPVAAPATPAATPATPTQRKRAPPRPTPTDPQFGIPHNGR